MRIAVASGKGGTGKTTVAVNLALSLDGTHLFDCDVEEPNVHTLLHPNNIITEPVSVPTPFIDQDICTLCNECGEFCQYNAIFVGKTKVMIYEELCHSCGGCMIVCPVDAIKERLRRIGVINSGINGSIKLTYGKLDIGEPMAVPVIKAIKARIGKDKVSILDASPGTSCTVIETLQECDYVILVTEPTPFGLHDMTMTIEVVQKLGVPFGVIINRSDIGDGKTKQYLSENEVDILMEIPFDRKIAELYSQGIPFVMKMSEYRQDFEDMITHIREVVRIDH